MKFKSSLEIIANALQKVIPALPRKSTLPILEHFYMSLKSDKLQIVATDQEITIQTNTDVEGELDGEILVPGRKFYDIVKALGANGDIEFSVNQDNYEITLKSKNPVGRYTLKGIDPDEYLKIPELLESSKPKLDDNGKPIKDSYNQSVLFTSEQMHYLTTKTSYAVSIDGFRPAMNGVLFQFRANFVNSVATDSYRLAKATIRNEEAIYPEDLDIIVPIRAIEVLKKIDTDMIMSFIESSSKRTHVRVDYDNTVFISKLIVENFPPYETVIPDSFIFELEFNQSELLSAINRVSLMTSEVFQHININIENDTFTLMTQDEDTGANAMETINCKYNDEQYELSFNAKYIKEAIEHLSNITDENLILMRFNESNRPITVKPKVDNDDLLMLIMPIRTK